ncbi:MAG: hypothetical protein AB1689_20960 [Thermodesulfobacteriota bacterium]
MRRLESRSTCGRPGTVVCCRTFASGRTTVALRSGGACTAPPGGSARESPSPYVAESCLLPDGGVTPGCGNGVIEAAETCDPPNGTTCNAQCGTCPAEAGSTLLGCTSGASEVAAATTSAFLVAWTDVDAALESHAVARRLDLDAVPRDAAPVHVSGTIPGTTVSTGSTSAATANESSFYVGWFATEEGFNLYLAGCRVPASGVLVAPVDLLVSHLRFGACGLSIGGPLGLAPTLDSSGIHRTYRFFFYCPEPIAEGIAGVGADFAVPPPPPPEGGNLSRGSAPLARGASDVAGVWWNVFASMVPPVPPVPPEPIFSLKASFIAPEPRSILTLTSGTSAVSPALAAVGDVFLAFFTGGEIRVVRFTRAAGPLDPDGGLLVATAAGAIGDLAAAGDGTRAIVAWREATGPGVSAIRLVRVAPDGTIVDPAPLDVASADANAAVAVAATSGRALVGFTRAEGSATSVRAVLLAP